MNAASDDPRGGKATLLLAQPFTRTELELGPRKRLSEGRWANAVLYRFEHSGAPWVVKDFASRSFMVRNVVGRVLVRHEVRGLRRVDGIAGAPSNAFRIDAHALAYRLVPGTSLKLTMKSKLASDYFPELERDLHEMHVKARLVHLDLRNAHNILVGDDGTPSVLDFQSWIGTRWMPPPLRRFMESIDLAAIYKHWRRRSPQTLGPERNAVLERIERLRPIWVLRGYIGSRRSRRKKLKAPP